MNSKLSLTVRPALVVLMMLMAATRTSHFGNTVVLPDVTLAAFFFAGLWLNGRAPFAILMAEAVLIDYWAITQLGVSDFCISPAYLFLLPCHAVLWQAGRMARQWPLVNVVNAAKQLLSLGAAIVLAFIVSNGSFFVLAEQVADKSWAHYVDNIGQYFPNYMLINLLYGVMISVVAWVFANFKAQWQKLAAKSSL